MNQLTGTSLTHNSVERREVEMEFRTPPLPTTVHRRFISFLGQPLHSFHRVYFYFYPAPFHSAQSFSIPPIHFWQPPFHPKRRAPTHSICSVFLTRWTLRFSCRCICAPSCSTESNKNLFCQHSIPFILALVQRVCVCVLSPSRWITEAKAIHYFWLENLLFRSSWRLAWAALQRKL